MDGSGTGLLSALQAGDVDGCSVSSDRVASLRTGAAVPEISVETAEPACVSGGVFAAIDADRVGTGPAGITHEADRLAAVLWQFATDPSVPPHETVRCPPTV
jgi:hypothetical protein